MESLRTPAATAHLDFQLAEVGTKRARAEPESTTTPKPVKKNRQDDVIKAIGDKPVTERHILEQVGDNRYTREILRRLMALEVVQRVGKGGSNDPYLYKFVRTPEEALDLGMVDPAVDIRMQRIETKILALLGEQDGFVTEKQIRAIVGDNTGTGKALRRLVKNSRVERIGRGGAGNPFTYKMNQDAIDASIKVCESIAVDISIPSTPVKVEEPEDCEEMSECSTSVASSSASHADFESEDERGEPDFEVAEESEEDDVDSSSTQQETEILDASMDSMSDEETPDYCMFDLAKDTCTTVDTQPAAHAYTAAAVVSSGVTDEFTLSFLA